MDKIAVVILNWNGCAMLRRFLPAVVRHSEADGAVVYVADNGSSDESVDMVHNEFPTVRVLALECNHGFAGGYNHALAQIEAEYVVLLNSDVETTEHWLAPLVEYMDIHLEVAACQPKLCSWYKPHMFEYAGAAGGYIDRYGYPFCRGRIMNVVEEDCGQYDNVTQVLWATGAALFIRRKEYFDAGGLDERFFAHMEEIDLCWRLRARGRIIVCVPQSVVYHVGAATLKRENPQKTYLNFRNNLCMLYKNLPPGELKMVMGVRILLDSMSALWFLFSFRLANARAIFQAHKAYRKMRPALKVSREENMRKAVTDNIPERVSFSLLWRFYVKGKRTFKELSLYPNSNRLR